MSMPDMVSANILTQIGRELTTLQQMVRELRSASGTLGSATVAKGVLKFIEGGSISLQDGGSIVLEDGGGVMVGAGGFITAVGPIRAVDADTGAALAYFGELQAPYKSGLLTSTPAGTPFFWAAELLNGDRAMAFKGTSFTIDTTSGLFLSTTHRVDATDNIILNTPSLRLYGMGDTGTGANVALDVIGGVPVLKRVVSSDRYKVDLEPVDVDDDDMLAYTGITWFHKSTLDETPAPWGIRRNVGNHAEAMAELPSLRQFVNYNDEGDPDSVENASFAVAVHEFGKRTRTRVVELEEQVKTLQAEAAARDKLLASALARLDALNGGAPTPSADTTQE
jgi:hypothetical protein